MALARKSPTLDASTRIAARSAAIRPAARCGSLVLPRCGDYFSDSFLIRRQGPDIPQDETSF